MTLHQHGLSRSIITHLRDRFADVKVDLIFDGYVMAKERPLITVEQMQNNYEGISKQRESIETIYRYQIGLRDANSVQLSLNQERLMRVFLFDTFTFYNTLETPFREEGVFGCELKAVTPMPNGDISKKSDNHIVYFDVEITDIKRRC